LLLIANVEVDYTVVNHISQTHQGVLEGVPLERTNDWLGQSKSVESGFIMLWEAYHSFVISVPSNE
jgi:hypothetical protein